MLRVPPPISFKNLYDDPTSRRVEKQKKPQTVVTNNLDVNYNKQRLRDDTNVPEHRLGNMNKKNMINMLVLFKVSNTVVKIISANQPYLPGTNIPTSSLHIVRLALVLYFLR